MHRQGEFTLRHSMIPFATVVLTDMLGAVLYFYFTLMIACVCMCVCKSFSFIYDLPTHCLILDTLWHFNRYILVKWKPMWGHCDVQKMAVPVTSLSAIKLNYFLFWVLKMNNFSVNMQALKTYITQINVTKNKMYSFQA